MAKVLEGPGMELFNKWGIRTPRHVVISSTDQIESLVQSNQWMRECKMVVKAHEAIGSRMKLGLVKVDLDVTKAIETAQEFMGREVHGLSISQVIIAEMLSHDEEFYLAVKSTREGAEILMAKFGGIEVESNWDKVSHTFVSVGEKPEDDQLEKCAKEAGFTGELVEKMRKFASRLYECYDNEDGLYMEINPLIISPNDGKLCALDAVVMLDGDSRFRHPDWSFSFAPEFGRAYTENEKQIMEIDSRVKGSVKLIEIPGGQVAMLPAGGGASVFYSDAVIAKDGTLANYAEYSGDPPTWAVEALTDKICSLPDIKHIIVGGAIANFTDVKATFTGIIAGFRKAKEEGRLKGVKIWVRRGGPNEAVGLEYMRKLKDEGFDIHVYDRYTPLTDIVKYALEGEDK
ncbi:ATP citrate synthase, alpha chain [hydrothermal vent metagenome]|uniref:ATP citrate synthase, alpha chain n=1 Tax=hydrothermal vent metagenome TaxID=652676 RepID=A0A3B1BV58_9ZZZZ